MLHIILAHGKETDINLYRLKFAELAVAVDTWNVWVGTDQGNKNLTEFMIYGHKNEPKAHPARQIYLEPLLNFIQGENVQQALEFLSEFRQGVLASITDHSNRLLSIESFKITELEPWMQNINTFKTNVINALDSNNEWLAEYQPKIDLLYSTKDDYVSKTSASGDNSVTADIVNQDGQLIVRSRQHLINPNISTSIITGNPNSIITSAWSIANDNNSQDNAFIFSAVNNLSDKKFYLRKNNLPPQSTDQLLPEEELLNKGEVINLIGGAIDAWDTGLMTPIVLDLESALPSTWQEHDQNYYVIQDMDISAPGRTGRAFWNKNEDKWEKVVDNYHSPDDVGITLNNDGELSIMPDVQELIDNSEQTANKVLVIGDTGDDGKYPSEKAVRDALNEKINITDIGGFGQEVDKVVSQKVVTDKFEEIDNFLDSVYGPFVAKTTIDELILESSPTTDYNTTRTLVNIDPQKPHEFIVRCKVATTNPIDDETIILTMSPNSIDFWSEDTNPFVLLSLNQNKNTAIREYRLSYIPGISLFSDTDISGTADVNPTNIQWPAVTQLTHIDFKWADIQGLQGTLEVFEKVPGLSEKTDGIVAEVIDTIDAHVSQIVENKLRRLIYAAHIYIRTDGSDDNDGLANTAERAFRTIAKAVRYIRETDLAGSSLTLNFGPGDWGGFSLYNVAGGVIRILAANPNDPPTFSGMLFSAVQDISMKNIAIVRTTGDSYNLECTNGTKLEIFGDVTIGGSSAYGVVCRNHSTINVEGSGKIIFDNLTVNSGALAAWDSAIIYISHVPDNLSGTVTGRKYQIRSNSLLHIGNTVNTASFPGSEAGVIDYATGGCHQNITDIPPPCSSG